MKVKLGLDDETRYEVGQLLNLLVADETLLYLTARDYHWNVKGPGFLQLHLHFEMEYSAVAEWIDIVAERARCLGVPTRGGWKEMEEVARVSADAGGNMSGEQMLAEILEVHEEIIQQLRKDVRTCTDEYDDAATANMLVDLLAKHETAAWKVRSQLETADVAID